MMTSHNETAARLAAMYCDGAASAERDQVFAPDNIWCEEYATAHEDDWTPRERAFFVAGHLESWRRCNERADSYTASERASSLAARILRDGPILDEIADALADVSLDDYEHMSALAIEGLAAEFDGDEFGDDVGPCPFHDDDDARDPLACTCDRRTV